MKSLERMTKVNWAHSFLLSVLVSALLIDASLGCSVNLKEGKIRCTKDSECPKGWHCILSAVTNADASPEGRCWSERRTDLYPIDGSADVAAIDGDFDASDIRPLGGSGGSSTGAGGTGGTGAVGETSAACDGGALPQCAPNQCGSISNACGTVNCPTCAAGSICDSNHQCISECSGCNIDGTCYKPGQPKPDNSCQVCNPAKSDTAWSPNTGVSEAGAFCDDGKYCSEIDTCNNGECKGNPRNCNDHCDCTSDSCTEKEGCVNLSTCPDNKVCDCKTNQCIGTDCGSNRCTINKTCYDNGASNPTNVCEVCDTSSNKNAWTVRSGIGCGVESGNQCAAKNVCDSAGRCVPSNPIPDFAPCGDPKETDCHGADYCLKGQCIKNNKGTNVKCPANADVCYQHYCDGNGVCKDEGKFNTGMVCSEATDCSSTGRCDYFMGNCYSTFYVGRVCGGDTGNPCTVMQCSFLNRGKCEETARPFGTVCDDHSVGDCENNDTCNGLGNCIEGGWIGVGSTCRGADTSNPCITHTCDRNHTCKENVLNNTSCPGQSDNPCKAYRCITGSCNLVDLSNGTVCQSADNKCKLKSYCSKGSCDYHYVTPGTLCGDKDKNKCLPYTCTDNGECEQKGLGSGAVCGNEDACNYNYTCQSDTCKGNPKPDKTVCGTDKENNCMGYLCNNGGTCNTETLVPINDNQRCGDSKDTTCTKPDTCKSGACNSNNAKDGTDCEDDGNTCTVDSCFEGACTHVGECEADASAI